MSSYGKCALVRPNKHLYTIEQSYTRIALLIACIQVAAPYDNTQWASTDNPVQLTSPLPASLPDSMDTASTIYPSLQARGTLYMPYGNIILSDGDVVVGTDGSLHAHIQYVNTLVAYMCHIASPCGTNMFINISACACQCTPGFTGITCTARTCANNGVWTFDHCTCPPPFTSASMCAEPVCPPNAIFNATSASCTCLAPWSGSQCSVIVPSISPPAIDCFNPYAGQCRSKQNWGVSSCTPTGICTCAPLYDTTTNSFIARQITCGTSALCVQWFQRLTAYCCTGAVDCERFQQATLLCATEPCCNALYAEACIARGCSISAGACVLQLPQWQRIPAIKWHRTVVDCNVPLPHPLCRPDIAREQSALYRSTDPLTAYTQIQGRAWPDISQFDIWDDGIDHSIVLSTPSSTNNNGRVVACQTVWRLAINYDAPAWSSLTWACDAMHTLAQTSFRFALVENSSSTTDPRTQAFLVPEIIGSVYTIWIANTDWCLLDRNLQQDEIAIYGITWPYQNDLVAINTGNPTTLVSQADCGLFIVQDNAIYTLLVPTLVLTQNPDDPSKPTLAPHRRVGRRRV